MKKFLHAIIKKILRTLLRRQLIKETIKDFLKEEYTGNLLDLVFDFNENLLKYHRLMDHNPKIHWKIGDTSLSYFS